MSIKETVELDLGQLGPRQKAVVQAHLDEYNRLAGLCVDILRTAGMPLVPGCAASAEPDDRHTLVSFEDDGSISSFSLSWKQDGVDCFIAGSCFTDFGPGIGLRFFAGQQDAGRNVQLRGDGRLSVSHKDGDQLSRTTFEPSARIRKEDPFLVDIFPGYSALRPVAGQKE